jgi:hypothetical protein
LPQIIFDITPGTTLMILIKTAGNSMFFPKITMTVNGVFRQGGTECFVKIAGKMWARWIFVRLADMIF